MSHCSTSSYYHEAQYGGVAIDRPWVVYQDPTVPIDRPMPYIAGRRAPYPAEPVIMVIDQPPVIFAQPIGGGKGSPVYEDRCSPMGSPAQGPMASRVYDHMGSPIHEQMSSPVRQGSPVRQQMGSPARQQMSSQYHDRTGSPVILSHPVAREPTSANSPAHALAGDPSSCSSEVSSSAGQVQSRTQSVISPASYPAPYASPTQAKASLQEKPVEMDSIEIMVEAPSKSPSVLDHPIHLVQSTSAQPPEDSLERLNVSNPTPVPGKPPKKTLKTRISRLFIFRKKKKDSAAPSAATSA